MNNDALQIAIGFLDRYYSSATTAFMANPASGIAADTLQIIILNEVFDYHTFEHFRKDGFDIEILIFPKSLLSFSETHFDFAAEYDLFQTIGNATLIKDTNANGERLQQVCDLLAKALRPALSVGNYKELFQLSRLISKLERNTGASKFRVKNEIALKIDHLLKNNNARSIKMAQLERCFVADALFLKAAKSMMEQLGGPMTFYSGSNHLNRFADNEFSILFSSQFPYEDFIGRFLIYLFNKLKAVTHKIKFAFKMVGTNHQLTIWTDNATIEHHIVPTLNQVFISNAKLYNHLRPKYPYQDQKQLIDNLLVDASLLREIQVSVSRYVLELRLNQSKTLSDGYRLSLGMLLAIEILQLLFPDKSTAKKMTNLLFEDWLSLSYQTAGTNWNDLELQSHKVLNALENSYLAQHETLESDFFAAVAQWKYTNASGFAWENKAKALYDSYKLDSVFNGSFGKSTDDAGSSSLQIILFEVLSILGLSNYNKSYIAYTINRLLHEA